MARRPTSSAGASRPFTSSGPRHPASPGAFDHVHYACDNAYLEEEEEDESDTEDLFAFLPPSTADQQRDAEKLRTNELLHSTSHYPHLFAHTLPQDATPVAFPSPTFDRYSRFPAEVAGPSSLFAPPVSNIPVDSPPSTISQHASSDPYRMRRLSTAPPTTETRRSRTSAISSREIHVDLPSSPPSKTLEDDPLSSRRKRNLSSTIADDTATLELTPSMLEEDSRDGSIKYVSLWSSFSPAYNHA